MSQVFSGDSVNNTAASAITLAAETAIVTGNFVNPPFQNAKALVSGFINFLTGTGTTAVVARIHRNPNAENLVIGNPIQVNWGAGSNMTIYIQAADAIPDSRPVQYQITVQQTGGTGNGTLTMANVTTFLISG